MPNLQETAAPPCPSCNSERVVPIVFGYPGPAMLDQMEAGKIMLGGCLVDEDNPEWHCKDCEHDW